MKRWKWSGKNGPSIKSDPMLASTMILQISASYISSQDRVRGLEGGADSYVTKLVEPDELIAQVKALLPGEVLASGELTWVIDVSQLHPQRAEAAVQSGLQVGFGFPLWAGHEIVAVLEFYTVWWSPEVYPLYGVEPESFTPTLEVDTAPGQGTRIILRY